MIAAIVLAAGLSRRMGRFKLLLPWGATTVLGQVVATLKAAGVGQIIVVTGHRADEIAAELAGSGARTVVNPDYASGEMLSSIRAGIPRAHPAGPARSAGAATRRAALPGRPAADGGRHGAACAGGGRRIRLEHDGHPQLPDARGPPDPAAARALAEILDCPDTLRTVLAAHRDQTHYLDVDTPTVLADLDTPEDYAAGNWQQNAGSR